MPLLFVGVAAEKDVARLLTRMDMHQCSVLPALLLAVVHAIERRTLAVELVIINCGRDCRNNRKGFGVLEGDSKRPLSAHANAEQSDAARAETPLVADPPRHFLNNEPLGSLNCIETW